MCSPRTSKENDMGVKQSDRTVLLREAIKNVLDNATEPMTAVEINEKQEVFELGLGSTAVSMELSALYNVANKPWPIKRIPAEPGKRSKWVYFNPKVVKLAYKEKAPVNTVKSEDAPAVVSPVPEFQFNPVEFVPEAAAAPEVNVPVPAGVKSITLSVAGVTIKIELGV